MKTLGILCRLIALAVFAAAPLDAGQTAGRTREVPATLDLRSHAEASINFLTRQPDPAQGMLPYFWTFFDDDPAELRHNHWDYCENPGRFLYGLVAARQVTGSLEGIKEERDFERLIYAAMTGGDGLCWRPAYSPFAPGTGKAEMNLWDNRSDFMGLLSLYMVYREPRVREKLEGMIDGLEKWAIRRDGYMYFEREDIYPDHAVDPDHQPRVGQHSSGWITPLIKYYQVTGSERARRMAVGLSNFVADYHGTSLKPGAVLGISNVHGALFALAGMIRTEAETGNAKQLEWAERLVRYSAEKLASSFGWVREMESREWMKPEDSNSCETCAVVDMIQCALLLAQAGYPEYWDLVECYVRNYFTGAQVLDTGWLKSAGQRQDNVASSYSSVPERVRGCFVGWGAPNDLVDEKARVKGAIQNCCGPHGAWGLFLVWHRIAAAGDGAVRVNLSLNKETPWCRVSSHRPYSGRVEVLMHRTMPLFVRVPGENWVDRKKVRCSVDGKAVSVSWDGDYVSFPVIREGQAATVEYPLLEKTRTEVLDGVAYKVEWKGQTVLSIDPPGKAAPLFERECYRARQAPLKVEADPVFRGEIDRALHEIDW
ncbi:MAG: hypothetical protein JXQ83_00545 [Candidatus Glassbacteria bacterium]|nr:hypothetical protein [Candidatus Glassbacteria bacterium]